MVWDKSEPIDKFTAHVLGIGKAKRISIPVTEHLQVYQQLADDLRALATEMDVAVRGVAGHPAPDVKTALPRIGYAVDNFNSKKRLLLKQFDIQIRDGRPPNSQWIPTERLTEEQAENRKETGPDQPENDKTNLTPRLVFKG